MLHIFVRAYRLQRCVWRGCQCPVISRTLYVALCTVKIQSECYEYEWQSSSTVMTAADQLLQQLRCSRAHRMRITSSFTAGGCPMTFWLRAIKLVSLYIYIMSPAAVCGAALRPHI